MAAWLLSQNQIDVYKRFAWQTVDNCTNAVTQELRITRATPLQDMFFGSI